MQKVLIDSDLIIDYLRTGEGGFVKLAKLAALRKVWLGVSVVTVIELYSTDNEDQKKLIDKILDKLEIVEVDRRLGKFIGEHRGKLKGKMHLGDVIIGLTAVFLKARLATRNFKDFALLPVKEWKG